MTENDIKQLEEKLEKAKEIARKIRQLAVVQEMAESTIRCRVFEANTNSDLLDKELALECLCIGIDGLLRQYRFELERMT